jgi:DNA-binding transcriptional LysR family regulator
MELRQLKTFRMAGKLLSFNQAADALHYAQSTVSAQIRALEEEFGVPLFDRLGKRVVLTEAGQGLLRYAQKMLDLEEETLADVASRAQAQGCLSIRIPQSLCAWRLPEMLQKMHSLLPNVSFDVSSCASYSLERELKSGLTDIAFLLADSISAPELRFEALCVVQLVVAAQPGHPLAGLSSVGPRDLQGQTLLLPKHDCSYRMIFEQNLTKNMAKLASMIELNSIEALKQCAARGVGVAVLPRFYVHNELRQGQLVALPWADGPLETAILMILHQDKWISPTLEAFMGAARAAFSPGASCENDAPG